MPGYVIGLDLGSRCVKAAVLKGSFRGYEVEDFLSLEPELPEDGSPPDAAAVFAAARAILDTIDQPQAQIVVGLPAERVSTWLLEMPFSDRRRLEATLPFEVENYVPWDLDTIVLDYQVQSKGPPARVFAAMAPRDRLAALLENLAEVGIDPRYVTVDAAALAGLLDDVDLGFDAPSEDDPFHDRPKAGQSAPVIIDIGATRTLITVCPDGQPRWIRSLDRGAEFLARHDVDPNATHGELDALDEEAAQAEQVRQARADKVARTWLSQLRASLLAAEEAGFSVERAFLCGGGAARPGLPEAIAAITGLAMEDLPLPPGQVHPDESPLPEPEHALAYALARRAFAKGAAEPVDFRKEEFAFQADSRLYVRLAIAGAAALFLLAFGMVALHFVEIARLKGEVENQNQLLISTVQGAFPEVPAASLGTDRQAIAVMQEKLSGVEQRVEALRGFGTTPLDALKIISEAMPNDVKVDIDEFIVNDEMIRIRGITDSFASVDKIEAAIKEKPGWAEAKSSDVNKARDGQMRFVVTIPREPTEETEG